MDDNAMWQEKTGVPGAEYPTFFIYIIGISRVVCKRKLTSKCFQKISTIPLRSQGGHLQRIFPVAHSSITEVDLLVIFLISPANTNKPEA